MNHKKLFRPLLLAAAAALALPALAQHNITVVNFGGANGAAQKKAYFEAYEKATGGKIQRHFSPAKKITDKPADNTSNEVPRSGCFMMRPTGTPRISIAIAKSSGLSRPSRF